MDGHENGSNLAPLVGRFSVRLLCVARGNRSRGLCDFTTIRIGDSRRGFRRETVWCRSRVDEILISFRIMSQGSGDIMADRRARAARQTEYHWKMYNCLKFKCRWCCDRPDQPVLMYHVSSCRRRVYYRPDYRLVCAHTRALLPDPANAVD